VFFSWPSRLVSNFFLRRSLRGDSDGLCGFHGQVVVVDENRGGEDSGPQTIFIADPRIE